MRGACETWDLLGRGEYQRYTSQIRTKCPFLYINCHFLIKMGRILNISIYPARVHGVMMRTPSPGRSSCSLRSSHPDSCVTWNT